MRVRADCAARGVGCCVHRHQAGGCRVSDLPRRADDRREAHRRADGRRRDAGGARQAASPVVPAGLLDERAESEGRIVLRVVLPAVRIGRQSAQGARVPDPRRRVRCDEHNLEQPDRMDRGQRDAPGFSGKPGVKKWLDRTVGSAFVGLGLRLATSQR
ncbi:hypothetical protein BDAG_00254 [Burkholderia dolosa AU0158]|nr:hypothetical protein BDAG_00254 [Burkholderia dolosa AU0158]